MGPSSLAEGVLERLVAAGLDCARLNFSHGNHETHRATAERVRAISRTLGRPVALLADLQGPKIRVGVFPNGPVELVAGQTFVLTASEIPCTSERACVSYPGLSEELAPGDVALLDDGLLALRVVRIEGTDVVCEVEVGGPLSDRKGVNFPGAKLKVPALTDKDRLDLAFAVDELKVDYLALSFVRRPEDIEEAKSLAKGTPIIAKIEKPDAIDNLEAILDAADGAMVARGDLGVELGVEKVPMVQKRIIFEANRRGKLVITATQMLDSMIRNPRPTRAEAADVANAILDGTDAIMLSGETASGKYPLESVQMMNALACEAEGSTERLEELREHLNTDFEWEFASAAARSAASLTYSLSLDAVVVFTSDGRSGELLASYRPRAPLFAVTSDARVATKLALHWGVTPELRPSPETVRDACGVASSLLRAAGVAPGSRYALVIGFPAGERTNSVLLQRVSAP